MKQYWCSHFKTKPDCCEKCHTDSEYDYFYLMEYYDKDENVVFCCCEIYRWLKESKITNIKEFINKGG